MGDPSDDVEAVEGAAPDSPATPPTDEVSRRNFLGTASTVAMVGGLAAGYGTFAAMAARSLYPAGDREEAWRFVRDLASFPAESSITWITPAGHRVVIARRGAGMEATDFRALSSTCPHLGCQVHWEPMNRRFFCPCHNGVFDPEGKGIGGPPGDAGQSLPSYTLKVEGGLLYILVPIATVADARPGSTRGHDPCLSGKFSPLAMDEDDAGRA
jgi:Rieske Fe-S protein